MKRIILLSTILLFCISFLNAQTPALALSKVGFGAGGDHEMPYGLDHRYLLSTANDVGFVINEEKFGKQELQRMQCDNGSSQLTVAMAPPGVENAEWRFSLFALDNRVDMVEYLSEENDEFLGVKATSKEIGLDVVYLRKDRLAKWITVYGGGGVNAGLSYDGEVAVTERLLSGEAGENTDPSDTYDGYLILNETTHLYEQKDGFSKRIFIQAGFGIHFLKKMEFGFHIRRGFGHRTFSDGPSDFTSLKGSVIMGITYNLW